MTQNLTIMRATRVAAIQRATYLRRTRKYACMILDEETDLTDPLVLDLASIEPYARGNCAWTTIYTR